MHRIAYVTAPSGGGSTTGCSRLRAGAEYLQGSKRLPRCNAVEIGDAIVLHNASRGLSERLNAAGYRVFGTDLSDFHKAGGSAKCLTLKLDDGPVCAEAAA